VLRFMGRRERISEQGGPYWLARFRRIIALAPDRDMEQARRDWRAISHLIELAERVDWNKVPAFYWYRRQGGAAFLGGPQRASGTPQAAAPFHQTNYRRMAGQFQLPRPCLQHTADSTPPVCAFMRACRGLARAELQPNIWFCRSPRRSRFAGQPAVTSEIGIAARGAGASDLPTSAAVAWLHRFGARASIANTVNAKAARWAEG
jgi:hypothetical protein